MKLRWRFSLIGLGIIIFLVITPFLILYARGFKIDFKNYKIVKTGALVAKTEPTKAKVYIDDKLQKSPTPASIRFLLPGDYNVRIEKDGYQAWTKRLSVRAQFVTWANENRDFVTLFLQTAKQDQVWNSDMAEVSKNHDEIAFFDGKNIQLIRVNDGSSANFGLNGIEVPTAVLNAPHEWENASGIIQTLENKSVWGLTDKQIAAVTSIKTNGNHYLTSIGQDLYSLDSAAPFLIEKNVLAYTLDGDNVWYIIQNDLKRYNLTTKTIDVVNQMIPSGKTGQIIRGDNQIYLILDGSLYVLNDEIEKIYDGVSQAYWDSTSRLLIFSNANEILTYNPSSKSTELILRSATGVKNPELNSETGYMFFQNEGKIKAVEMDGRDHRNVYTISDDAGVNSSFAISDDGTTLYTVSDSEIKKLVIR